MGAATQRRFANAHDVERRRWNARGMAAAAIERGYKFIGITDHTQGLSIAGGLDETRLPE
jgi:hypothetical protein